MVEKEPRQTIEVETDFDPEGGYTAFVLSSISDEKGHSFFGVVLPGNSDAQIKEVAIQLKTFLTYLDKIEMDPRDREVFLDHLPRLIKHFENQATPV